MTIKNNGGTIRDVNVLSLEEKQRAKDFLQRSVYCWCKNKPDEEFAVRTLVGAENADWRGTPLQPLYDKHRKTSATEDDAYAKAAKDAGWLLKRVIKDDKRKFNLIQNRVNHYIWLRE
ncbi:hypothetical protein [Candidatus Spongiihabitans sp.]|uniref:hypothetical protein n=1 Tax=Candidatus Spongiihabitans sp. TaxID=3101308 RepID=UPI003C704823